MTDRFVYLVDSAWNEQIAVASLLRAFAMIPVIYASEADFLCQISVIAPGCVISDANMSGDDSLGIIASLSSRRAHFPVVVIARKGDVATAVHAMKCGAIDCLEADFEARKLAIMLLQAFSTLESEAMVDKRQNAAIARMNCLSDRERTVFYGLACGRSNKILAYELGLSIRTIEMHRSNMMNRLGVHTLAEAMTLAFDSGLDLHTSRQQCSARSPLAA